MLDQEEENKLLPQTECLDCIITDNKYNELYETEINKDIGNYYNIY